MIKCWNCGTEHEGNDMQSYIRGQDAAIDRILARLEREMCEDSCDMCEGIALSAAIIKDEFNRIEWRKE